MKAIFNTLFAAAVLLPLHLASQDMSIIPAATFKASLMKVAFSKGSEEISLRFNEAVAKSPEWFQAYLQENKDVKPLPYHPNFGISREDYETMLKLFETKHLEKVSDVVVKVSRAPDGSLRMDSPELGKSFSGILVDASTGKLTTPWLSIDAPEAKSSGSSSDGNPFGNWHGVSWKKVESDPLKGNFKSVSLIAGQVEDSGLKFLTLRVKVMENRRIKTNFELILQVVP